MLTPTQFSNTITPVPLTVITRLPGGRILCKPSEVFQACAAEHGIDLTNYMYMDSLDATTHNFKNITSRKYITVCL
jgi:hypothetical protein